MTPAQRRRYEAIHGKSAAKPKRKDIFNPQDLAPKEGAKAKIFQAPPPAREGEPELRLGKQAEPKPGNQAALSGPAHKKKPNPVWAAYETRDRGKLFSLIERLYLIL
jgi:hypothetical protein